MPFPFRSVFAACALLPLAVAAQGTASRAYLSLAGSDANPCTQAAPCRLLPAALAAIADGGEVWMLDSANFNTGPVALDKGFTLRSVPGAQGSLVALGGPALQVITGQPVMLRNVTIVPFTGNDGQAAIDKISSGSVTLEDVHISGFRQGNAVQVSGPGMKLTVARCSFTDNRNGIVAGPDATVWVTDTTFIDNREAAITAFAALGGVRVTAIRSTVRGSATGISVGATGANHTAYVHVSESQLEGLPVPGGAGIRLTSANGALATAALSRNGVSGFDKGIDIADGGTTQLAMSSNKVTGNATGVNLTGRPTAMSLGDNFVRLNDTDLAGLLVSGSGN